LDDVGVDWKIILQWFVKKWYGVNLIGLAQDKGKWRALVETIINIRVP
jgi:hypothetical protein